MPVQALLLWCMEVLPGVLEHSAGMLPAVHASKQHPAPVLIS